MEGFGEKKENLLSVEQQEKVARLKSIVNSLFDYLGFSKDVSEEQAEEVLEGMLHFAKSLEEKGLNPEEFFLWNLLNTNKNIPEYNGQDFDTPDGEIEKFIMSLEKIEQKIAA